MIDISNPNEYRCWEIRYLLDENGTDCKKSGEQAGCRPVLISSNSMNNKYSPTVEIVKLTKGIKRPDMKVHVIINDYKRYGLKMPSTILMEQKDTVSKSRLGSPIGYIDDKYLQDKIKYAYTIQCGFFE